VVDLRLQQIQQESEKKLDEASGNIGDASKKSRNIESRLKSVEELPPATQNDSSPSPAPTTPRSKRGRDPRPRGRAGIEPAVLGENLCVSE